jgi:hypothetical protein
MNRHLIHANPKKLDWSSFSEMILSDDGLLHMVKCSVCSSVRGRAMIMGPKFDTVKRHGKQICLIKNTELYAARRPITMLQQIQGCSTLESRKKVCDYTYFLLHLF